MPIITKLSPQRNKKHVNVYVDGKFSFGIDLDNLYKFGIKVEKEYSKKDLEEINKAANFSKTFNQVLRYVTSRPHSESEVNNWFYRKKVDDNFRPDLIAKLKKLELLDDEKFAVWWVKQRIEFKKKSIKELKFELLKKGIDSKLIDKIIREADIDESELIKKLAEKKLRSLSRYDEQTQKKKLGEFLMRKGFGWEEIKKVLEGNPNI